MCDEYARLDAEKLMNNNLFFLDRKNHLRLRKLALPAFSPRIMEQMKERFTILVKDRFDEIGTPDSFNFAAEVAEIVPTQAIASLVGIPRDKFPIFDSLAYGVVRGINPGQKFIQVVHEQLVNVMAVSYTHLTLPTKA